MSHTKDNLGTHFGRRVKQLREARGWSYRDLSDKITEGDGRTVTHNALWGIENSGSMPLLDTAQAIANAFGVPLADLTGD